MNERGIFLYPPPRVSHPQRNVKINPKHLEAEKKVRCIFRMLNPLRHTDAYIEMGWGMGGYLYIPCLAPTPSPFRCIDPML